MAMVTSSLQNSIRADLQKTRETSKMRDTVR